MTRPIFITILGLGLTSISRGQGTFNLRNHLPFEGIDAPVFDGAGNRLAGTNYAVALYGGPTPESLQRAGSSAPVGFQTGTSAGYFGGDVTLANVVPGGRAYVQVRAWNERLGGYYEDVAALGIGGYGESSLLYLPSGGGGTEPALPTDLIGLQSFSLRPTLPLAEPKRNAAGEFTFSAAATLAGKTNVIEASTNLVDWTAVAQVVPSTNRFTFMDTNAANFKLRFYRLRLEYDWTVGEAGSFLLSNRDEVDAPVYDDVGQPLSGSNYWAQLYAGRRVEALQPVFPSTNFASWPTYGWGYFYGGVVQTTNVVPRAAAWVQVKAWDGRLGSSYEEVVALGIGGYGESEPFQVIAGYAKGPEGRPLTGLRSFRLRPTFRCTRPQRDAPGRFSLTAAAAAAGKTNVIEASTNLVDWAAIAQVVPSTNTFTFVDTNAPNFTRRFYRLRLEK